MTLAMGMYLGGPSLPVIRDELGLDLRAGALIVSLPWGAFVVGALAAPVAARAVGVARAIAFGMALAALGLGLVVLQRSFVLLLVGVALFGASGATAHVLGSAVAADAQRHGRPKALVGVALAFAVGAFAAPLAASVLLGRGLSWRLAYIAVVVAAVANAALAALRGRSSRPRVIGRPRSARLVLGEPPVRRAAIGLMLYLGTEATITGWLVTLLQERGQSEVAAGTALALFWTGVIGGRLASVVGTTAPVQERGIARAALAGSVGFLLLTQVDLGVVGTGVVAFGTGSVVARLFPAILGSGTARATVVEGAAALTVAAGGVGGIAIPWLVGAVAGVTTLQAALAAAAAVPAVLALLFVLPLQQGAR